MVTPRTQPEPRAAGGGLAFTLVELIAVIAIAAILAGVAIPALGGFSRARAGAAASAVTQHLSFARERVLNLGSRAWVVADIGADTISVLAEPEGGAGLADASPLADPQTGRPMVLRLGADAFAGIGISSADFGGHPVVGFDWLGAPLDRDAGPLETDGLIELTEGPGIRVRALSGDIRLTRP